MHPNRARALTRLGALAVAAFVIAVAYVPRSSGQTPEDVCDVRTTERVVVVGDIHGAYDRFVAILRMAGILNGDRWAGGRSILIQTGDVLDRGAQSRRVVDLLRRLEREAARAGGRVYTLLGNHEFMRLVGDWRYVSAGELKAFQNGDSEELRQRVQLTAAAQAEKRAASEGRRFNAAEYRQEFMKEVPLGFLEMRRAFDETGEYGRWVRERPTVVRVNGILFVHGGVSEKNASLGCEGLNAAVRRDMAALPVPAEQIPTLLPSTEDGPLWYRGMARDPEDASTSPLGAVAVDRILKVMNARAVVVGHTPVLKGAITPRFDGRVILIDTGMLGGEFFPGGVASALEIQGTTFTAIYERGREAVPLPALQTQ
jgi:hypothetical protein